MHTRQERQLSFPAKFSIVPAGVRCSECKYDLRGQNVDGRCPECGTEVWLTMTMVEMVDHNPRAAEIVSRRLLLSALSILFTIISAPVSGATWDLTGSHYLTCAMPAACALLRAYSVIALTTHAQGVYWDNRTPVGMLSAKLFLAADFGASIGVFMVGSSGGLVQYLILAAAPFCGFTAMARCVRFLGCTLGSRKTAGEALVAFYGIPISVLSLAGVVWFTEVVMSNSCTAIGLMLTTMLILGMIVCLVRAITGFRQEIKKTVGLLATLNRGNSTGGM